MGLSPVTDVGAHIKGYYCGCTNNSGAPIAITAAGTGDNTAVTGKTIDRLGYDSCVFTIAFLAALTEAKTLTIAAEYQESADNSTWDTAVALQAATLAATGDTGGSNEYGEVEFDLSLRSKKRYIRLNFTPDLTHTGTDTAIVVGTVQLGGKTELPAT